VIKLEDLDGVNHTARVRAQGSDAKGRGAANATASFRLEPAGSGSKVLVHTDLALSGAVAQYGRGVGIIQATAAQIMTQFAANLKSQIAEQNPPAAIAQGPLAQPSASAAARPISGLSLMAKVVWNTVVRLFTGRNS
jgi:hypothetical protein